MLSFIIFFTTTYVSPAYPTISSVVWMPNSWMIFSTSWQCLSLAFSVNMMTMWVCSDQKVFVIRLRLLDGPGFKIQCDWPCRRVPDLGPIPQPHRQNPRSAGAAVPPISDCAVGGTAGSRWCSVCVVLDLRNVWYIWDDLPIYILIPGF